MNREIKFRAWDKNNVRYKGRFCIGDDGSFIDMTSGDASEWKVVEGMTVDSYTGLKDKNGVEIYEGDVVRTQQFANNFTGRKPNGYSKPRVVEWKESVSLSGFNVISRSCHLYEVIGNIYENPELLEQK